MFTKNYYAMLAASMNCGNKGTTADSPAFPLKWMDGTARTQSATFEILSGTVNNNITGFAGKTIDTNGNYNQAPSLYTIYNGTNLYYGESHSLSYGASGVIIGTGTQAPSVDDYKLSGDMITSFYATTLCSLALDNNNKITVTGTYNITNTGIDSFTVGEIALIGKDLQRPVLYERSVLDNPITIAPGETKTIVYKIDLTLS